MGTRASARASARAGARVGARAEAARRGSVYPSTSLRARFYAQAIFGGATQQRMTHQRPQNCQQSGSSHLECLRYKALASQPCFLLSDGSNACSKNCSGDGYKGSDACKYTGVGAVSVVHWYTRVHASATKSGKTASRLSRGTVQTRHPSPSQAKSWRTVHADCSLHRRSASSKFAATVSQRSCSYAASCTFGPGT